MARIPAALEKAPALYLAALFALNVYRAATQSFVIDEAYSYQLYIGREPFALFRQYDANLHVLHTLLVWFTVKAFGLSELAFRLPSLAGCALYFAGVRRLSEMVFADSWRRLLAVALLTANPLIEDHMSVGRGYGLALGFFAWAFCEACRALQDKPRLPLLAALLALSVASNFTFLFPATALVAALAVRGSFAEWVRELAGPWLMLTFLILVLPFSRLEPGAFYYGADSLRLSWEVLARYSAGDHPVPGGPIFAGAVLALWGSQFWLRPPFRRPVDWFAILASGTLLLTVAAVITAHALFGVLYPRARTGIYLLFLASLALLPLACWRIGAAALFFLSVAMAQGIRIDRYMEWTFDANSREIAAQIVERHASSAEPVRVACRLPVCRSVQVYAAMWKLDWAEVREVEAWEPGFDYYILAGDIEQQTEALGLRVVYRGPESGAVLAAPAGGLQ